MMELQLQSRHRENPSSSPHAVTTWVFGRWALTWTTEFWVARLPINSSPALMRQTPSLIYLTPINRSCISTLQRDSNKGNICGCSPSQQLRDVAGTHYNPNLQTFPRFRRNSEGAHETTKEGSEISKSQASNWEKHRARNRRTPPKLIVIKKLNDIFIKIYELVETIHTDQTGAFPVTGNIPARLPIHHGWHP